MDEFSLLLYLCFMASSFNMILLRGEYAHRVRVLGLTLRPLGTSSVKFYFGLQNHTIGLGLALFWINV